MKRGGIRGKHGAYFFVIDAFIAASILSFTLVLLFTLFIDEPQTEQNFAYAHDYLDFLSSTEIRDFRHGTIINLTRDGHISDTRRTIAEQIIILYEDAKTEPDWLMNITAILSAAAENLPSTLAMNVSIRESPNQVEVYTLYEQKPYLPSVHQTHLIARSVEYGVKGQDTLIGPYIMEVDVWS